MVHCGPPTAEIGWRVWGTPANFKGVRVLASLRQCRCSLEVNQTLHDVWPSFGLAHYIYTFGGLLPPDGILPGAKFTLHPSLAFYYIGSVTTRHSSSRHQPKFPASYKEWNYGHLYSAGWPSHWASAHILVSISSAGGDVSS